MTNLPFSISETDAARKLGWPEETLARIRKSHELPHVRLKEGVYRYTDDHLMQVIRRFTPPANEESK